mgnify:CR=1 FL=1
MLINANKTHPVLSAIERSIYEFYLGGSRRMAQRSLEDPEHGFVVSEDTDYDYAATYTTETENWLQGLGFYKSKSGDAYDLDAEAVCIYKYEDHLIKVDVILRKGVRFYAKVFEAIPVKFYKDYLWKSSPSLHVPRESIAPIMNALFLVGRATE